MDENNSIGEPQPADFVCAFRFKAGGTALYSIDVLVTVIEALTALAQQDFQKAQPRFQWTSNHVAMRFTSNQAEGVLGYQIKTIMWSIRVMACFLQTEKRYSEVGWASYYRETPNVGFGQLTSVPLSDAESSTNMSSPTQSLDDFNQEISVTDLSILPNSDVYSPSNIYSLLINLLIAEAEKDLHRSVVAVTSYNERVDLSLEISATSVASAGKLSHSVVILAIRNLAQRMPSVEARHRWKQFTFLIRDGRKIVGRGAFAAGPPPDSGSRKLGGNVTFEQQLEIS